MNKPITRDNLNGEINILTSSWNRERMGMYPSQGRPQPNRGIFVCQFPSVSHIRKDWAGLRAGYAPRAFLFGLRVLSRRRFHMLQNQTAVPVVFQYHKAAVRVIKNDKGEPWWIAKDVCAVLGMDGSITMHMNRLDEDEFSKTEFTITIPQWLADEKGLV